MTTKRKANFIADSIWIRDSTGLVEVFRGQSDIGTLDNEKVNIFYVYKRFNSSLRAKPFPEQPILYVLEASTTDWEVIKHYVVLPHFV